MITNSPTPFLNCQILNKNQPLCNDSAQGRFIFAVSKGLEVKFSDESLSSPAKGVTPSIKFTESLFVRGKSRRDQ